MKTFSLFLLFAATMFGAVAIPPGDISPLPTGTVVGRSAAGTGGGSALTTLPTGVQDNITRLGTVVSGVWSGTVIVDGKIASALTGKTYNGLTITSTTGTLTIAALKTLTVSNTLTLAGTEGSTLNIGAGGTLGTAAFTAATAYAASGLVTASGLTLNTARLLGRTTASAGAIEEISVGSSLSLTAGSLNTAQALTTTSTPSFNAVNFPAQTTNAYGVLWADMGFYRVGAGFFAFDHIGAVDTLFQLRENGSNNAQFRCTNGVFTIQTNTAANLILGTNATTALTLNGTTQAATFAASITTAAPTAGTAGAWKLGAAITSSGLLVSTTVGVRVNIGGSDVTLATLTTNP